MSGLVETAALVSAVASLPILHAGRAPTMGQTLLRPHTWSAAAMLGFSCWHFARPETAAAYAATAVAVLACVCVASALAAREHRFD